jgi:hypothetical protein
MANQMRFARVVLQDVEASHQEITIDLVLDGNQARRGFPFFGLWVDKNEESLCPFVAYENGEVDFGTGYSGDDRIYETDLLDVDIVMGQQVGWRSGNYETQLRVVGITQLV